MAVDRHSLGLDLFRVVKLPENPMKPRLFDSRVGFFSVQQMDYGIDEQRAPKRTYITRWRLEKKDPTAAMSEPVKPIVFYIDPATDQPHIYGHSVVEEEVEDVLDRPMEDRAGRDGSRIALGQTEAGRYLRVIYVPDPPLAPYSRQKSLKRKKP